MIIRSLLLSLGVIIFVLGIMLFLVPGPFGIPTMAIGLSIMLKASDTVKRITLRLIHKNRHSSRIWYSMRNLYKRFRKP
ncbi:MAG: hypothetical protein KF908_12965 [Nitrosomonas sp.]|nr:hypothetical protein [Nitrosomonas sp.]MCW5608686.1 hypothetical protein [Nitrosomonas sp.]